MLALSPWMTVYLVITLFFSLLPLDVLSSADTSKNGAKHRSSFYGTNTEIRLINNIIVEAIIVVK